MTRDSIGFKTVLGQTLLGQSEILHWTPDLDWTWTLQTPEDQDLIGPKRYQTRPAVPVLLDTVPLNLTGHDPVVLGHTRDLTGPSPSGPGPIWLY